MSFWDLSDGDTAKTESKEYEIPTGGDVIPDNSTVLAMIDKAEWKDAFQSTEKFINLTWVVMEPEQFANRKVFQKIWVTDFEPNTLKDKGEAKAMEKRDKARQMLATIDANCGGSLQASGEAPTNDSLAMALTNKAPLLIKVMEWEIGGNRGNWVAAVMPRDKGSVEVGTPLPPKDMTTPAGRGGADMDDEIPF